MGREANCEVEYGGKRVAGKAHLETDSVVFRGDVRLTIPFKTIASAIASEGSLRLAWDGEEAIFHLGTQAENWAQRMLNPPGLMDKLGVKSGMFVCLVGLFDKSFKASLIARGASLLDMQEASRADILFLIAESPGELHRIGILAPTLRPNGAVWVVTPRGRPALRDIDVMVAGKAGGLVDVKVCRFSDTHTALKFVIPRANRKKG